MIKAAFAAMAVLAVSTPALAQEGGRPLSSIDWLSDSVASPDPIGPLGTAAGAPAFATLPPPVEVLSLDAPVKDSAGAIPAATLGLPPDLWARSTARDAAAQLSALPADLPLTASKLLRDVMMMQADPPLDARIDDSLFFARVDKLLAIGHLDDALALMNLAPVQDAPELFRRRFDIDLLRGTEADGCARLEATPDVLGTFPARIFCLARNGEWDAAALTLGTAEALGFLTPAEDLLLLKFLDPELFEDQPAPPAPTPPSPLVYRLYDAIGERLATDTLPTAFAEADLRPTVGWKTRLRAAERLTAATAMPLDAYFAILNEGAPAASGGIWDRVAAIQAADRSLRQRRNVQKTLARGWRAAHAAGIAPVLAADWAKTLPGLELTGASKAAAFEIALLGGQEGAAANFASSAGADHALLQILAGGVPTTLSGDALSRAILRGLVQRRPSERFVLQLEDQGSGPLLLTALRLTAEGRGGDPDAVGDALTLFRALGLEDVGRRIAVELLLEDRTA